MRKNVVQKSGKTQNKLKVSWIVSWETSCGRQICKGQNIWGKMISKEIVNHIYVPEWIVALHFCKIMACQEGEVLMKLVKTKKDLTENHWKKKCVVFPFWRFPCPLVLLLGCSSSWALCWCHRSPLPCAGPVPQEPQQLSNQ